MKYKVAVESDFEMLEETVNELMANGWFPVGGVIETKDLSVCQAMVKEDDSTNS
jgi:hypothetical protein